MAHTAATHETLLNSELARYLRSQGLEAFEEQRVRDSNNKSHVIDVLVNLDQVAVAIEAEFEPKDGRADCEKRMTARPLIWQGLPIRVVYAVSYPKELKQMAPNEAFAELVDSNSIKFTSGSLIWEQVNSIDGEVTPVFWHSTQEGSLSDLSELFRSFWIKTDHGRTIDRVVQLASIAIEDASQILTRDPQVGVKNSDPASTMALIWLNALLFQELLSRNLDLSTIGEEYRDKYIPRPDPDEGVKHLLRQWKDILQVNWWPIFDIARSSLKLTPSPNDRHAIDILKQAAAAIAEHDSIRRHDIAGRIFHRLLDTRKFLATNYTTIPAAIMLAGLAIDDRHTRWSNVDFGSLEAIAKLKIADPACGSGTLLMAVVQEIFKFSRRHELPEHEQRKVSKILLEDVVWGFDVVPAAIHLAASTLAMAETHQLIDKMNLWRMKYGIYEGRARLGSLDFLNTSDMLGNAARLALADDTDATRIHGYGEVEEGISLPKNCDLIIANPPYTRAGSPGDKENTEWNPIFGSILNKSDQRLMNDALKRTLARDEASLRAGLGSAFVVLANQNVALGGRIAFVLPATALTGTSWKRIRKLLLDTFEIDWVVASHDPGVRRARKDLPGRTFTSFSESTNISEVLLVATKCPYQSEDHVVRFVNLRCNPMQTVDALSLTRNLLSQTGPSSQVVEIGKKVWGEIVCTKQASLSDGPWLQTAFIQSKLLDSAIQLIDYGNFGDDHIPLKHLGDCWEFGPYHMQIKNPKYGLFDVTEGYDRLRAGPPALWHHNANEITTMLSSANAQLHPRADLVNQQTQMLKRAGKLQFACELRLNTQRLAAVVTDQEMLGVRSWFTLVAKDNRQGVEECMCLWLNSTPGLFLRIVQANRPYPGRTLITHTAAVDHLVLDTTAISTESLLKGKNAFDQIRKQTLRKVAEMDKDPVRQQIDEAICDLVGITDGSHFATIAQALVDETLVNPTIVADDST